MVRNKKLELKDFGVTRKEKILKNGCRLVLFEKKNSPIFVSVKFLAGSRFNPENKEGLSHFVEHMLIAGSKKFKTKDQISMFLEKYGGSFVLSTNNNFISIDADIGDGSDIDILISFLNEIINNPLFDVNTFKKEMGSIISEIGKNEMNPQSVLTEEYLSMLYKGTPLEKNNLGTKESVEKITLKDVIDFYHQNITPENCTIIASGDIKIDKLSKKIEEGIKFKNKGKNHIDKNLYSLPEKGNTVTVPFGLSDQTIIRVGFRIDPRFEYFPILNLISLILSGGRYSRLIKKLRYETGLVYSTYFNFNIYEDVGSFIVGTVTSKQNLNKVLEIILEEIENIKKNGLTKEELEFIKNKIYKSSKKELQTSKDWVKANIVSETIGCGRKTNVDLINDTMKITNKDIIKIANKYFQKEKVFIGFCK